MRIAIRQDMLDGRDVEALVADHRMFSEANACRCADHALDMSSLRASDVTFWSAWEEATLLGFGALKQITVRHGEIKSMHTDRKHRGKGVGAALVSHILGEARRRRYQRLSLETGASDGFAAARGLYARFGFTVCGPYHDYPDHPDSVFMTLDLTRPATRPS